MAAKNWTKRKVTFYGGPDHTSAEISITVYGHDLLTASELRDAADALADQAMLSLQGARHIHAPLSRIKAERRRS